MPGSFNAAEIFDIAMQIERNGAAFYRKAAEGKAGETSKPLLLKLAEMEVRHEQIFASMREELSAVESMSATFDPDGEAALFLQQVADGHVFNIKAEPAAMLSGKESAAEVLKFAIGIEKNSIVFYTGIQGYVDKALGRDKIARIIAEEMSHVTLLSKELAKTPSP